MPRSALFRLAAVCAALVLLDGIGEVLAQDKVGVSSAVNPNATGTPPGGAARKLVIGQDVVFNERIATEAEGQTQLLFVDESSMTVGPNSDLTIDQFVYDPKSGSGKLAMSATKGLLRFVGGKLSKQDEAVTLRTNSATLAIRGGAFIANIGGDGRLTAIFIYGRGLTITGVNGVAQTVQRPGFEITVAGRGAAPSAPTPASAAELNQLLAQLDGRSGGSGGATTIPSEQTVASSGVGQTISGDFNASVQQATAQLQTATAPTVNPATVLTNTTGQSTTSLSLNCALQANCTSQAQVVATTLSGQPVGGSNSVVLNNNTNITPPVTLVYAGRLKNTNGNGTARGFAGQGGTADFPYSGGTLTFPQGQPQNGVFNANFGSLGTISFPLVPGTSSFQGTSSLLGPVSGTSFLSPDNSFFYASLVPTNAPTERGFIFGGTAVNPSFYQPTGGTQPRTLAFNVQPDAALQSAIPFVRNQAGGALPNASVSPFLIVSPANTAFGDVATASTRGLQGSLAISGQGANQQSALVVATGAVGQQQANGQPIFLGEMRGSSQLSAFSPPVRLSSAVSSTIDGAGNSFYGSNSISGFVLDQTRYNNTAPGSGIIPNAIIPSTASETQLNGNTATYGFAQPALPAAAPAGVGTTNLRTTQTLTGNVGGLNFTSAQSQPYIVGGPIAISTDATTNQIAPTINATAQTPSSGYNTLTYQLGSVNGTQGSRQAAFIDDRNFAAVENRQSPQQVNGQTLVVNGDPSQAGQLYLVNANVAPPPNSLLNGTGASYCACPFLQWGY